MSREIDQSIDYHASVTIRVSLGWNMEIKPFEKLLNRTLNVDKVEQRFSTQLKMLVSIVDYGSSLIAGTFHSSPRKIEDIIVITVLLKQVVSLLDSIEVLSRQACSQGLVLQGRALLEASFFIDFMLIRDTRMRAKHYYVSNIRHERIWCERMIAGTQEKAHFDNNIGGFSPAMDRTREQYEAFSEQRVTEINALLDTPEYRSVNDAFAETRGKRKYEPAWHLPLGFRSIKQIAVEAQRLPEYEMFYSMTSEAVHSSRIRDHVSIGPDQISLTPIRHIDGLPSHLTFIIAAVFHSYRRIIEHYRPGQLHEYTEKYNSYWRDAFLGMPENRMRSVDDDLTIDLKK